MSSGETNLMRARSLWAMVGLGVGLLLPCANSQTGGPVVGETGGRPSATPTIQARSNLVILDVVVTDRSHKPVHDLKAADFQLREGDVPQKIKSFEEHSPASTTPAPPMATLPPGVFTNYSPTPANGPANVLLIDRLNTPLADQPYLHDQLVGFLRRMKPGTPLAIFGLNTQLLYLQGFSGDPAVLLAALEAKKNGARTSPLLNPQAGDTSESLAQGMADAGIGVPPATPGGSGSTNGSTPSVVANVQQFEAEIASSKTQLRVRYTLDAMNVLARYLAAIPGRKNLIWLSGSFPISILPNTTDNLTDPFAVMADMTDQFRETTGLLSRAQVAVYPIDARGLQSPPMLDASRSGSNYVRNPTAFGKDLNTFNQQIADEHGTMRQMAHDTGGQAFVNTNGLAAAVNSAVELGSSYYTLTYTPTDTSYDGRYRKIHVEFPDHALDLSYRRGYYTEKPARVRLTTSPLAPQTPEHQAVSNAMIRGTPGATQILFKALVVPAGPATETTVAEGNILSPRVNAGGPFRRYSVNYAAIAQDVAVRTVAAGSYEAHLEFVVFVYTSDGVLVNRFGQSVTARLNLDELKTLQKTGIQYHQIVSVPARGEYFLRVAVHDLTADRIGTLEVPVSAVQKLPVVAPDAPVANPAPASQRTAPTLNNGPK